jgi:phenylalanyl-tRNA synthetase beta chain
VKVVYSWLREFCPTDLDADGLAELLVAKGIHVEEVLRPWAGLEGVIAARVLEVRDHPNSEKLSLARVDTGSGEGHVVVGVRNMQAGDVVPYAPPGSRVPALPEPLGEKTLRGEVSQGMLCSPRELALSGDHGGILILPADTAPGTDFKTAFGLDDAVVDIEIEPNRPDLMSVRGVAREASMATGVPLRDRVATLPEADEKAEGAATVEIRDRERCPRYLAKVIRGVTVGPSPLVAQARLTASGMRPISNVVDATNYALLELGHPLHPFDLHLLAGPGIVVRRAAEGETLVTLDDVERKLGPEDLVIADLEKPVAIAGVMGSAAAEVSDQTRDVLLESAYFEPLGVLRTARRLGLRTEANMRFERGADPEAVPLAADRAAQLMAEWAGGTVLAGAIDVGEAPPRRRLSVRPSRATLLLGDEVTSADIREAFGRLAITAEEAREAVEVEVPGYRVDLLLEVDLIEEVARVRGYDQVPSTLPSVRQAGGEMDSYAFRRRVRGALARAGLREAMSLSFASAEEVRLMEGDPETQLRVSNPLAADEGWMRNSLLPGLVRALARNRARQVPGAALYEVGHVFLADEPPYRETEEVAFAFNGSAGAAWTAGEREFDFYDAKGALEFLMTSLGIAGWRLGEPAGAPYHPARSAEVLIGDEPAGVVGELDPDAIEAYDLPGRAAAATLFTDVLARHATSAVTYREIPRFPPARRDLAFVVDAATPAEAVRAALVEAAGELGGDVALFDVFAGTGIPEGKVSLAFSVDFRAPDRTLTDDEADAAVKRIVERLKTDFGAELRSG